MVIDPNKVVTKELSLEEEQEFMWTAPIAEVAKYLGVDLDLAVQLRVDEAVSRTYDKIAARQGVIAEDMYNKWALEFEQPAFEVTVRPIEPQGNLYGFASVTIGGIRIDDFKIIASKDGDLFVGMPSKADKTSKTGYRNTVFVDKDLREEFSDAVLGEYHAAVEQARSRATNTKAAPDKPRMADQMAKANKEAERHNANLSKVEKNSKKHDAGRE